MSLSAVERVRRFYQQFANDDRVLIAIQADPDAMASAMAIKRLLWRKTASAQITHINPIDRPDNRAMVQRLGINLLPYRTVDITAYSRFVIVDSQPAHNESFEDFIPDVVIDHHPDTNPKAAYTDVRPHYGATASIMTEYLRAARIRPSVKLATGLVYAIKTDTRDFERQTVIEDVRAFQYLFKHANTHLINKIEQEELRFDYLKYFNLAFKRIRKRKDRVIIHLGKVSTSDVCVIIADFFMRVQSINWSIVSGITDGRLVVIFRNDGIRKNAGRLAQQSFGDIGTAGGHKSMARAEVPLEVLSERIDPKDDKKMIRWVVRQIETRAQKG